MSANPQYNVFQLSIENHEYEVEPRYIGRGLFQVFFNHRQADGVFDNGYFKSLQYMSPLERQYVQDKGAFEASLFFYQAKGLKDLIADSYNLTLRVGHDPNTLALEWFDRQAAAITHTDIIDYSPLAYVLRGQI
jgi:hypothetical protein